MGQLVRVSIGSSYTTEMCVNLKGWLLCHDNDVGVVTKFKMLLQNLLLMTQ